MDGNQIPDNANIICRIPASPYELILAENPGADKPFSVWRHSECSLTDDQCASFSNYYGAINELSKRMNNLAHERLGHRKKHGLGARLFTGDDCLPASDTMDYEGKLLLLNPKYLKPEYRLPEHQLVIAGYGAGCMQGKYDRTVHCENIFTGGKEAWGRYQFLGIIRETSIPEWGRAALAEREREHAKDDSIFKNPVQSAREALNIPQNGPTLTGLVDQCYARGKSQAKPPQAPAQNNPVR